VAIGRAIVRKPEVFLFDEPLSNLDASLRVQMRVEISRLHRELKTTMIYVTHDQVEAMTLGQRIVVINAGRIEQVGTPHALYNQPGNLFVAGFLGAPRMNFMEGEVAAAGPHMVALRLAGGALVEAAADGAGARVGDKVTLGVRAEHLALQAGAGANLVAAEVGHIEYLGDQTIVYALPLGGAPMIALRLPQDSAVPAAGSRIGLHVPAARCHVFDAAGLAFQRTITRPV
jgi:multiple sugar transport system ATP-binding protein